MKASDIQELQLKLQKLKLAQMQRGDSEGSAEEVHQIADPDEVIYQ